MLKNIDPLLNGTLLALLDDMGHGDELVLADANFPAASLAARLVDLPGVTVTDLLRAVLTVFPLDDFVAEPVAVMQPPGDAPPIFADFTSLTAEAEKRAVAMEKMDRYAFYARAKGAYAIIATGETRLYANIVIKKGVIRV
ncbi:ribose ABC transporter [Acetobacteraceae bacterium H6797]|nr:ribose ABC transporter [Acetobacteraceae bacterium H6797]